MQPLQRALRAVDPKPVMETILVHPVLSTDSANIDDSDKFKERRRDVGLTSVVPRLALCAQQFWLPLIDRGCIGGLGTNRSNGRGKRRAM
jgi:hypothetical protein